MKKSELQKIIKEEIENTLKEQPSDSRFKHQPADDSMLDAVKSALRSINQQALSRDTADLVFQNEININEDGDVVIKFYSKPRK